MYTGLDPRDGHAKITGAKLVERPAVERESQGIAARHSIECGLKVSQSRLEQIQSLLNF